MLRTIVFSVGLALVFAWNWGRLQEPRPGIGPMLFVIAMGIAPALLPTRRWRLGAALVALPFAASFALDVSRPYAIGKLAGRAGGGFLDFYDVLVPFEGAAHPLMHGVLLLAVFLFSLLAALAVASRRPLLAGLVLVAGAGWPATIFPASDDLERGAVILAVLLALVAWLGPEARRAPPQILAGTALVIVALVASSSGTVAKGQFLDWQNWDLSTKAGKPVNVEYIWRANYDGVRFPKQRTRVFTVRAPARSTYWRATTLDAFTGDRWDEDLFAAYGFGQTSQVDLSADPLLPAGARDQTQWKRADVTIDGLRDARLVGPSQPVYYDTRSIPNVQYEQGGVALASSPLSRGDDYSVWGYTPQPTPKELAGSRPDYPPVIADDGRYLRLGHSNAVPAFGTPEHALWASQYFRSNRDGQRYRLLYAVAARIAGKARNPYAATVALEAWFRSSGGFVYDEQPGRARGMPPLVWFVTHSKRGYCQHFAGAMALMLRYLGIPSRVAAGFTSGKYDSQRRAWTVYDRDAHTWVEVWFRGYGWLPFDPTPGRGTLGGPYTTSSVTFDGKGALSVLAAGAIAGGGKLLRFELGNLGKVARARSDRAVDTPTGGTRAGGASGARGLGIGALIVLGALAAILLLVLAKVALRRSRYLTKDPRRQAAACRREVVEFLRDQKIDIPASIGPRELGHVLGKRAGVDATEFATALGQARFGPLSTASIAARQARRELRGVRRGLRQALPLGRRVRGLFSVRSLLASS